MKLVSVLFALLILALNLTAGESGAPAYQGSAELAKLKTLAGTWKGTHDMGKGPVEVTVVYRVVAGGSAVEERIFPGTPEEMVTMYYDKQGKLSLTHYCMLHNQPGLLLKS